MSADHAILDDRAVIAVDGVDARDLLQRLVTNDVETLAPGEARYAALLTPQGKIVTDFVVVAAGDAFLLDTPAATAADFVKKLLQYRLRAKVTIADRSSDLAVVAFAGAPPASASLAYADPREGALWQRALVPRPILPQLGSGASEAYHANRIRAGVPEGTLDFPYGDTFPHEANLDHLHGVDFTKGCYVGQEVVSRVHHRGTARRRIVPVAFAGAPPPRGTAIVTGDVAIGTMGSAAGERGLASIRLDKLAEVTGPVTAGDLPLRIELPAWVSGPSALDRPAGSP